MQLYNQHIKITLRLLLILLITFYSAYVILIQKNYLWVSILFAIITVLFISLITSINKTNRRISLFFNALENNDSSLHFQEKGAKSFKILYQSINKVNQKIQNARLDSNIQEQYYKSIIEHSPTGIISIDADGNVDLINSSAKLLLNCTTIKHITFIENQDIKSFLQNLPDRGSKTLMVKINTKLRVLKFNIVALSISNKWSRLISIEDIRSEIDAKEVDSWIKLISILTHEIMNTISPITSIAGTLKNKFSDNAISSDSDEVTGLQVIEEQGEKLMHFVQTYRNLSKIPEIDPTLIQLENLFTSIFILFKEKAISKHISISIDIVPKDLTLFADEKLINQVLINLVKNAMQAIGENGEIILSAKRQIGGKILISVTDNGTGIPKELTDKIFIPFFTTKENGTGIGLSLARQIMHLHNGSIELEQSHSNTAFILIFR